MRHSCLLRLVSLTLFLLSSITFADQLIIEPEMGRAPILSALHNAHYSVNLVMYGFTDPQLLNAFIHQKNISKKIILESHPYKREDENNKTITSLAKNNIAWHGNISGIKLIHQKTLLIDNKKALVMTFNFTRSAFKNDRNFALLIDHPQHVKEIATVFAADWNQIPTHLDTENLFFSPGSRHKIAKLIRQAKQSINIYAQHITDYHLNGLLAQAARKGIKVNILTSQRLPQRYLQQAGVNIHYSKKFYIHAKVIIIDNKKALLGSINMTHPSLDLNRELSVLTTDSRIVAQLTQTFFNDWET